VKVLSDKAEIAIVPACHTVVYVRGKHKRDENKYCGKYEGD
jgi:hypothetical protein